MQARSVNQNRRASALGHSVSSRTTDYEMPSNSTYISIIVPAYNNSQDLLECLSALTASSTPNSEIIVVDDASTDDTHLIATRTGVRVIRLTENSGPASARNHGARHAKGKILIFVDADIVVSPGMISRMVKVFEGHPDVAAVFGSYDSLPRDKGVVSQYRNLFHHFVHQNGNPEASTFWAGFGAIRRSVFEEIGGFDENSFRKSSIEDIALGYRLRQAGYRILLDKSIQVTHLKRWSLRSVIFTDIFYRAIPWSKLILDGRNLPSDLNLQLSHRVSAVLVSLLIIMLTLTLLGALNFLGTNINSVFISISLLLIISLLLLNRNLYAFFFHKRGIKFLLFAIPLHFLYYLYSGWTFATCWILHKFSLLIIDLKKVKTLI